MLPSIRCCGHFPSQLLATAVFGCVHKIHKMEALQQWQHPFFSLKELPAGVATTTSGQTGQINAESSYDLPPTPNG